MDMKLVDRGNEGEILVSGRIDSKNAQEVGTAFLQIAGRFKNITLNFSGLKYISSAGLRAVKNLYLKVRGNGGELTIINASPRVADVFEMTGFAEMLNLK